MEEMFTGDTGKRTGSTYKHMITNSLQEFTRPARQSDTYGLALLTREPTKKGRTVS